VGGLPEGGKVLAITRWGSPVMHHPCEPVKTFDSELERLVADMTATMEAADGVGLAGNQVGLSLALFVFRCQDDDDVMHEGVVCNPVLAVPEGTERRLDEAEEGCLSLPGAYVPCARPDEATVRGVDHHGEPIEVTGTGLLARCLQHETDHLGGIVFGDRLSKRWRKRLFAEHEKVADHYPATWPIDPMTE
jgi:peptide deformylase